LYLPSSPDTTENSIDDCQDSAASATTALRREIEHENRVYHAQARHDGDAWDLLRNKVRSVHWRSRMLERLLAAAASPEPPAPAGLVEDLLALNVRLDEVAQARLAKAIGAGEGLGRVLAHQGQRHAATPHLHDLAGPDLDLDIEVNRDSPWPFERWSTQPAFAEYRFEGNGVRYRGLLLQPGDLILPNVNLDGNFVYSALSDPKGFCPHSAVFVMLEANGLRYPAVLETYEKGLRAVPLCVFLNARYISYAEIYRHRDLQGADVSQVSGAALALLALARGYNFNTLDHDDCTYVCCTTVARQLYQTLGLPVLDQFGAIRDPGIRANMQRLDYEFLDVFFTPIDFVRSDVFRFVGVVDNAQPARLIARELVEQRFRHCFSKGTIRSERLPLMVKLTHFGIGQMRGRTLVGRLISGVMGFDHISLPKGPDRILAIVEPLEVELGKAVRGILPEVQKRLAAATRGDSAERADFDLDEWLADPSMRARVEQLLPMRWLMG
jgi:hypothetical protein